MSWFRKKPVVIEARQFDGSAASATPIINWILENGGTARYHNEVVCGTFFTKERPNVFGELHIDTLEGTMTAQQRDWIIRGVQGEFYPCKPDIFAATYELADDVPIGAAIVDKGWTGRPIGPDEVPT